MAPFYAPCGPGEVLPRYSFIEPLLAGRRVLEIGTAGFTDGASALFLVERGAAAVLSIESDAEAIERASRAASSPFVQFRRAEPAELPDAAFDLVLVADGAPLTTDPALVAELRRLVSADGHLVTAIRAPGAAGMLALAGERPPHEVPSYESFIGALAAGFEVVEVATQSAMVGYVLAPAEQPAEGEPEIIVDGALAGPAEAAYYLALCGRRPTHLSGLTLVALPPRSLAESAVANAEAVLAHASLPDAGALEARIAELEQQKVETAARTAELERQVNEGERVLAVKDGEVAEAHGRLAERDSQLAEKESRLQQLEIEVEAARSRAAGLEAELERERQALTEARGIDAQRAAEERAKVLTQLEEARAGRLEAEASAQAVRAEAQAARSGLQAALTRVETAEARASELEDAMAEAQAGVEAARAADRSRLEAIEAELSRLRASLETRDAELAEARRSLSEAVDAAHQERGEVETRLGQATQELVDIGAQRDSLADRVRDLEDRCQRFEQKQVELSEASETAQRRAGDAATERDAARLRIEELEARLLSEVERADVARSEREQAEKLAAALLAVEEQARAEQARAETAQAAEAEARSRAEAAEAAVARLEESNRETAVSATQREEQAAETTKRMEAAEARALEMENRLVAAESRAADLERQVASHQSGLEADRTQIRQEAERLSAQLTERTQEKERLSAQLTERVQELERAVSLMREVRAVADTAQAQAAGLEAELQAVRWEKDEVEQRLRAASQAGAVVSAGEIGRLREELAARVSDLAELRGRAEKAEAEVTRLTEQQAKASPADALSPAAETAAEAKIQNLERRLAETVAKLAKAEAQSDPTKGGIGGAGSPAIQRLTQERDTFVAQVAERDARIARLQREVADKTDRLGRLAKEMGEIKSKGLGKLFSR